MASSLLPLGIHTAAVSCSLLLLQGYGTYMGFMPAYHAAWLPGQPGYGLPPPYPLHFGGHGGWQDGQQGHLQLEGKHAAGCRLPQGNRISHRQPQHRGQKRDQGGQPVHFRINQYISKEATSIEASLCLLLVWCNAWPGISPQTCPWEGQEL